MPAQFTLRVTDDREAGVLRPDTRSLYGGTDAVQAHVFAHLFLDGVCLWVFRGLLFALAEAHGWTVKLSKP